AAEHFADQVEARADAGDVEIVGAGLAVIGVEEADDVGVLEGGIVAGLVVLPRTVECVERHGADDITPGGGVPGKRSARAASRIDLRKSGSAPPGSEDRSRFGATLENGDPRGRHSWDTPEIDACPARTRRGSDRATSCRAASDPRPIRETPSRNVRASPL